MCDLGAGAVLAIEVDEVAPIVDSGEVPVHHRGRHGDIDVIDHASGHGATVPVGSAVPVDPSGGEALFGFEKFDQLVADEVLQLPAHQGHPHGDIGVK